MDVNLPEMKTEFEHARRTVLSARVNLKDQIWKQKCFHRGPIIAMEISFGVEWGTSFGITRPKMPLAPPCRLGANVQTNQTQVHAVDASAMKEFKYLFTRYDWFLSCL